MISKHLLLRTSLLFCTTLLFACGGSSGSGSNNNIEEKTSEDAGLIASNDDEIASTPIEENVEEAMVTVDESEDEFVFDDLFVSIPTDDLLESELIIPDDADSADGSDDITSQLSADGEVKSVDLNISWEDNSDDEVEFIIERRIESNVDYGSVFTVTANVTSYDDLDVQTGETYCYRISASNSVGDAPSSEKCITL